MIRNFAAVGVLLGGTVVTVALADNLTGEDELLCAPGYVTHCSSGGDCETKPSDVFGIPSFLRFDLDDEVMRTSEASEDELATPIQSVTRANGEIYLQGVENGRMFSILIDETTGDGALAIIADGETATAFLACTVD
jgi:hypothetical protein